MNRFLTSICFIVALLVLLAGAIPVSAVTRQKARELREEQKNERNKPEKVYERKSASFSIQLLFGKAVGDAAKQISEAGSGFQHKLYGGGGIGYELPASDNIYFAGTLEAEWNWPHKLAGAIRVITAGVRTRLIFSPYTKSSVYVGAGVGSASGQYLAKGVSNGDLGSHLSFYFSLGHQVRRGEKYANSVELFFRHILTEGGESSVPLYRDITFDVSTIGIRAVLDLGF